MSFPATGDQFPDAAWLPAFEQYQANDAWFSGDQAALQEVYAGTQASAGYSRGDSDATHYNKADGTKRKGGLKGLMSRFFNGKIVTEGEHRTRIHAPVASNLATLSADVLLSEPAVFRLIDADGKSIESGKTGQAATVQDRLDRIMNTERTHRALAEAAELAAGLSAVALTAHWDRATSEEPWLEATPCDAVIPEFAGGRLAAATMYTTYPQTNALGAVNEVYVHIERHEPGVVIHGLARLSVDGKIQAILPLDTIAATQHIPSIPGSRPGALFGTVELPTGIDLITVQWWRNLPTRNYRKHGVLKAMGRADFEGVEIMLDAVDEVWSSWMRDIKIARARLIVPETFLDLQGPGLGGSFDDDREILTALQYTDLGPDQGKIEAHQFSIRAEEHAATLLALTREITQHAGYSLSSYGERADAGAITATEVSDRTTMTERTRDKKFLYLAAAVKPLTHALLELDRVHYRGAGIPKGAEISIEIPELSQLDPEKEARTIQFLDSASAVSIDTKVRMQHPDWEESQISAEVARIREEKGIVLEIDAGDEDRVDPLADIDAVEPGEDDVDPTDAAADPAVREGSGR